MSRAEPARTLRYRPELDGLRAVAVLLVVVHHCIQPHRFSGFIGVDIFFVLSGFLITSILDREIDLRGTVRLGTFYVKRLLRLYPALLLMLVVTLPLAHWLAHSFSAQLKDALYAATYTGNLSMTYRHHWLGPYTHTWSLALEEQYYLVWPLVLLVALRLGLPRRVLAAAVFALGIGASALSVRDFTFNSISFPLQSTSAGLLVGSALGLAFGSSPGLRRALGLRLTGAAGVALLIAVLALFSVTRSIHDGVYVPAAVLATALLIGHTGARDGAGLLTAALSWRPAVWIGRISYGVYLWHYPILFLVDDLARGWSSWLRLLVVLPASLLVAALSFTLVETPFLRLKDRLGRPPAGHGATGPVEPAQDEAGATPPATAR